MSEENKKYKGWLVSNNFWKRAIAVWAYGLVVPAILVALMFILIFVFE